MYQWESMSDLYLHEEGFETDSRYYPAADAIPDEHLDFARLALEQCKAATRNDFRVTVEGVVFRGFRMKSLSGRVFQLRRMPSEIWKFSDLGYPERIRQYIMHPRHRQGLWIITGSPGAGKSTSTATLISERLKVFGGLAITAEDPPEMPLEGPHGAHGYCYQMSVDDDKSFSGIIRESMRSYPAAIPGILLIGEVRDPETALLALQSAIDGRLVIATMHASSCSLALERMTSLASSLTDISNARNMVADSLRLVVSQRLSESKTGEREINANFLMDTQAAISIIKDSSKPLAHLKNEILHQNKKIASGDLICVRD